MKTPISFDDWKRRVDREIQLLCGLSADDLPDFAYYLAYEAGRTPQSVAKSVIKAAGSY